MALHEQALNFLTSLGVVTNTGVGYINAASEAQQSDANAYASCYDWYIENQKVLPENAALAAKVWVNKYALHDANGICLEETPVQMWDRIAKVLAEVEIQTNPFNDKSLEKLTNYFRGGLTDYAYSPQGSGLYSLGNPYVKASSSNCFVLPPPEDSLNSIFETAKNTAKIYAARGGVGFSLSKLRPKKAKTANAAKTSTGAVSFMDFYSYVTGMIGQCIEENQQVLTQRGYLPIKEVISGDMIWTRKGWIRNNKTVYNGIRPVYKLTTKRGYDIIATNNHILVTSDSGKLIEKQLGDFVIGDSIVTMPGTPVNDIHYIKLSTDMDYDRGHGAVNKGNRLNEAINLPKMLDETLAYYLGYSFGDGYVEYDKFNEPKSLSLASSHSHPQIEQKLISAIKNHFGYEAKVCKGDGALNKVTIYSKKLCYFLQQNSLLKQKHNALILPESIKKSKTSVQMAFISGYFDADGYASGSKKGYVISSVHMPMLSEIQKLLMSAGIVSHLSTEIRTGEVGTELWKDLHSLSITGASAQAKALSLLHESIKISNKAFISKKDSILTPFNAASYGIKYNNFKYVNSSDPISGNSYRKLHESGEITDNVVVTDIVVNIESVGNAPVYDLQLESEHLFLCEEMIVHNSGRRGAEMLSMEVSHPDIFDFINEKRDNDKQGFFKELADCGIDINDYQYSAIADRLKSTSHANVSVMINDHFMDCVKNDLSYELRFDFKDNLYPAITKVVKATDIWNELMKSAWESAEPGILNWDHIVRECPADQYSEDADYTWTDPVDNKTKLTRYSFATVGVNPCAEETLSAYDSCNLGIFNLPLFVSNPFTDKSTFDWDKYRNVIQLGVRAQDNIKEWDIPRLPLELNRMAGILGRRISVGNTGLADCLAALGFSYDSDAGLDMAEKIYEFLAITTYTQSIELAAEKGAFPVFNYEKHSKGPFIKRIMEKLTPETLKKFKETGIRNISLLTQAPAGSMSILFRNCSSGIEPVFMLNYTRNVKKPGTKDFEQHVIYHQAVEDCYQINGKTDISKLFIPANDINWSKRVLMQSRIQKHIDHSISSTINLPNSVTVEEISKIYMEAYDAGLKGITVYRDGCRTGVLVSSEKKQQTFKPGQVIERPKTTDVTIHKTRYKDKSYMILVGKVNGVPCEVFGGEEGGLSLPTQYKSATLTKKSRGHYSLSVQLSDDEDDILKVNNIGNLFPAGDIITLTRMISLSLRNGINMTDIVEQLGKASSALYDSPAVFARILKLYIPDEEILMKERSKGKKCPECGESLDFRRESGCVTEFCTSCNFTNSKCG